MTQRTIAGLLAVPMLVALWVYALTQPVPFVTYSPGLTINVLGSYQGRDVITVSGHQTYQDSGQLRLTTVYVTLPATKVNLFELMSAWQSHDDAVLPKSAVYPSGETNASNKEEGQVQMVSSQDVATAVAMRELGYDVPEAPEVFSVGKGTPADGRLEPRDVITKVGDTAVHTLQQTGKAIQAVPSGQSVTLVVKRKGERRTVEVTPADVKGTPMIGIRMVPSYDFPFFVSVGLGNDIGGPSAGLMFSLGIYDLLSEGSLTDGQVIAGTGEIKPSGKVGPIGGIDQKIAAAREAGAQLFMVPPANCADALDAARGDMTLVKASTMHSALQAIEAWGKDRTATLPACSSEAAS
jgi:PDZ domain-containing protein